MDTKKDKRKNAEVSITGTLPRKKVVQQLEKTLSRIQKEIELPGFRKGKVPLDKVREQVGGKALWKESAESALKAEIETILKEHKVLPILPVSAALSSVDPESDVPFEIVAIVAPTCSIENYKETAQAAIAKVQPLHELKEKESAIAQLRAQARQMAQSTVDPSTGSTKLTTGGLGASDPLSDDEAQKVGFENSKAFEFFLEGEAERAVKERELQLKRGAIAEALIEKGACDIPMIIIRDEAMRLLDATKKDIASQGLPFNDYLKRTGKTEEQIRDELAHPAEKRVALDLIFAEIARKEEIKPDEKEEERLAHALVSQGVEHEQAHRYVRQVVMREKVWELLGLPSVALAKEGAKAISKVTEEKSS